MRCWWYLTVALTLQQWLSAYWFTAQTAREKGTESGCVASAGTVCDMCACACMWACSRHLVEHYAPKAGRPEQQRAERQRQNAGTFIDTESNSCILVGTQQIYSWQMYTNVNTHTDTLLACTGQWPCCGSGDKRDAMQALGVTVWECQKEMLPHTARQSSVSPSA